MNIVEWDDMFLTGNADVDEQHRDLFRIVNELHQAILEGKGREVTAAIGERILSHSTEHFRSEERLMEESSYPDLERHRTAHAKLIRVIEGFHRAHGSVAPFQLLQFLVSVIRVHMREVDAPMIRWIRTREETPNRPPTRPGRLNVD